MWRYLMTVAMCIAAPATSPAQSSDLVHLCPLGDHVNVSVYDFIGWELGRIEVAPSRDDVRQRVREDAEARGNPNIKPPHASLIETPLSHLMTTLCQSTPACLSAAVYDASGMAVALSNKNRVIDVFGIEDDDDWAAMTQSSDGNTRALVCNEAKRIGASCKQKLMAVALPVYSNGKLLGVARCVVKGREPR